MHKTLTAFSAAKTQPSFDFPRLERLVAGNPQRATWAHFERDGMSAGLWGCEPGAWRIAFAALLASLLLASIYPPVRSDTLWAASFQTTDLRRQNALRRAAAMSYFRRADITAADVEAFYQVFILGKEPSSEPTIEPTKEPVGPAPKRPK